MSLRESAPASDGSSNALAARQEIYLRDVADNDLPAFFAHQCEPRANEMAAFPARDHDAFMAHWAKIRDDATVSAMTIVRGDSIAGNVLSWVEDDRRFIGYWVGSEHWGQGVATAALSEYLRVVTLRPLHAYVAKHNVASIRVLEKCGFVCCKDETNALKEPADGVEQWVYRLDASAI